MEETKYNLTLIPTGTGGDIRRLQIPKKYVYWSLIIFCNLIAIVLTMLVHYTYLEQRYQASEKLKVSNKSLHYELNNLIQSIRKADRELNESQRFEEKLRNMTNLADDSRTLNLRHQTKTEIKNSNEPLLKTEQRFETIKNVSTMSLAYDSYSLSPKRIWHHPRTKPVLGWLTSPFGPRPDPFTGEASMHLGVDIAAKKGAEVKSTAQGQVLFAGTLKLFGKMVVIDHGHGINTHYGHLSELLVEAGDHIAAHQIIGQVGNTGISTGTHLHYEIRIAGVPVDPQYFWQPIVELPDEQTIKNNVEQKKIAEIAEIAKKKSQKQRAPVKSVKKNLKIKKLQKQEDIGQKEETGQSDLQAGEAAEKAEAAAAVFIEKPSKEIDTQEKAAESKKEETKTQIPPAEPSAITPNPDIIPIN